MDSPYQPLSGTGGWQPTVSQTVQADISATKTLFNSPLQTGWQTAITVPAKKTYVISNIWASCDSAALVKLRHTYLDGTATQWYSFKLTTDYPGHHVEGAKVLEAGSILEVYADVADVGLTLDGTEITQT